MQREDYGYVGAMWNGVGGDGGGGGGDSWGAAGCSTRPRRMGVAVYFITGRPGVQVAGGSQGDQTAATAKNLEAAGFHGWLVCGCGMGRRMGRRPLRTSPRSAKDCEGVPDCAECGDQWSDLLGEPQAAVSVSCRIRFIFCLEAGRLENRDSVLLHPMAK